MKGCSLAAVARAGTERTLDGPTPHAVRGGAQSTPSSNRPSPPSGCASPCAHVADRHNAAEQPRGRLQSTGAKLLRRRKTQAMSHRSNRSRLSRIVLSITVGALALSGLGACSSGGSSEAKSTVRVTLIVKTLDNPYFIALQDAAKAEAKAEGIDLALASGKGIGDEASQIASIENAISRGENGIVITPASQGVEDALIKARAAGLKVVTLDTVPADPKSTDVTFATDNFLAGEHIGEWAAGKLAGATAKIGLVIGFSDQIISVDVDRNQGFLTGMGIDAADRGKLGDEKKTGKYSGGSYIIEGSAAGQAATDGSRTATETLLSKNPDINLLYVVTEPGARGAFEAVKAAGKTKDILIVTIDGACQTMPLIKDGTFGATSGPVPRKDGHRRYQGREHSRQRPRHHSDTQRSRIRQHRHGPSGHVTGAGRQVAYP